MFINQSAPKYIQTAVMIRNYIEDNSLKAGARLPGGRKLAKLFDVSHHTIFDALELLKSEGIVEISPNSGTYVAEGAYELLNGKVSVWDKLMNLGWQISSGKGVQLAKRVGDNDVTYLSKGIIHKTFGYENVLIECINEIKDDPEFYDMINSYKFEGFVQLRNELMCYLKEKSIIANQENIVIFPNIYVGFEMIVKSLLRAGVVVYASRSVACLQYNFLKSMGVEIVIIPDDEGFNINKLKEVYMYGRTSVLITTSLNLWTDVVITSIEKQHEILSWCEEQGIPIIEVDMNGDLMPNYITLKSIDKTNNVLYIGSLPTYMSFGINVAWSIVPNGMGDKLIDLLVQNYRQPMNLNYYIVLKLLSSGRYKKFLKSYQEKLKRHMTITEQLLNRYLSGYATWVSNPYTGLYNISAYNCELYKCINTISSKTVAMISQIGEQTLLNFMSCSFSEEELECNIKELCEIFEQCSELNG